jgi:leucyl-tRNA synthetase
MRLTLADAGDSIEDANFEVEMAEAQMLRLYTFIEWVKETLCINPIDSEQEINPTTPSEDSPTVVSSVINWVKDKLHNFSLNSDHKNEEFTEQQKANYRTDTNYNYYDHVFESEINRIINLTAESYEKMLYKDVLKYGFFELQIARDNYRELCSESEQMNLRLIKRFIEVQVILLAPICPHVSDYVYQFLHPGTTIMNAKWPTAGKDKFQRKKRKNLYKLFCLGKVDQSLIDSCNYLMDTAHDFRLRVKSYKTQQTTGKSKGSKTTQPPLTPTHATIFVAQSYPSWQTFVINELKQLFLANNHSLPDSKQLAIHFKDRSEIDKKYQKKLMPFVIYSKDLLEKNGDVSSLDRHLSFDEYDILQFNQDYLRRALDVEQIDIRSTDGNETDAAMLSSLEDILPGKPFVHFRHEEC